MTVLISKSDAATRIGIGPRTLMRMVTDGEFPSSIRLGSHPLAQHMFIESEIEDWISERVAERDAPSVESPRPQKRVFPVPKRKRGRPSNRAKAIRAAILKLDPDTTDHWVSHGRRAGQPKLSAVRQVGGLLDLFHYREIDAAAPGLTRETVRAQQAEG